MSNADNPKNGADFQEQVRDWFQDNYDNDFELEVKIPIGNPPKEHKFDIVSTDNTFAIECKRHTWTESGNVPSAKMGFANEAAFYLSFLPDSYEKYIVMLYSFHEKRKETLAEYYYRTNRHLLGKIKVAEFNPENKQFHIIGEDASVHQEKAKKETELDKSVFRQEDVENAISLLHQRESDIARYCELMQRVAVVNVAEDMKFQKAFSAFYGVRRDNTWKSYYFNLFENLKTRSSDISFGEIQLRLFQHCGQVESSFSSKMLATLNPDMPIWDRFVLNNLGLKLKGKNAEERLSRAVVLYDNICSWYRNYMETDEARTMVEMFDQALPRYKDITKIKKIDFILWALR